VSEMKDTFELQKEIVSLMLDAEEKGLPGNCIRRALDSAKSISLGDYEDVPTAVVTEPAATNVNMKVDLPALDKLAEAMTSANIKQVANKE